MAVHHHHLQHLHYHRLHLPLLAQSFILNLRLGFSANHLLHRPFPFNTGLILRTLGPISVFILLIRLDLKSLYRNNINYYYNNKQTLQGRTICWLSLDVSF